MTTQLRPQMKRAFRSSSRTSSRQVSRTASHADRDRNQMPPNENTPLFSTQPNGGHNLFRNSAGEPLYKDDRAWVRIPMSGLHITWEVLKSNYANVLLVFVPLGIIAGWAHWSPVAIFVLNFLAIIPLAGLLAFATEELAAHLGETLGGLLNATFGNAVELIVSIFALLKDQIRVTQASMLGSILSNMLLVLGCCFIAGGLKKNEQVFDVTAAQAMSSLMAVATVGLVIPATLYAVVAGANGKDEDKIEGEILIVSHGTAIIFLLLYITFLYFQLFSHKHLFEEKKPGESQDSEAAVEAVEDEEEIEDDAGKTLNAVSGSIFLIVVTVVVAVCADYLVDSIDAIVAKTGMSKTFIGLVLIPIVGNAAEHVTAVVVSYKNKMNLALGVAIGSSMQIALFVTPFLVILGWATNHQMTLNFQVFETVVFFLSVLVVNYLIQDGRSNYLEGCMCLGTYLIIAVAFYVYPDKLSSAGGGK